MRHRGPDGERVYRAPGIILGMRRLAVIDVEGGQQPVWNETRDVAVVMNGEIYDYVELLATARANGRQPATRSGTEAVVHAYEDHDLYFVDDLRGMFALALFDRRRRRLILARDRFGKKPLHYAMTHTGGMVFASELKADRPLLVACGMTPEIDPQAIYDFLSLGSVPQPATVYKGVHALAPGTLMIADDAGVRQQPYWAPDSEPNVDIDYAAATRAVREAVGEAVRI